MQASRSNKSTSKKKSRKRKLVIFRGKIKQLLIAVLILVIFWIIGLIVFYGIEIDRSFSNIVLVSLLLREGADTIFYSIYRFLFPLLFELLILSIVVSFLLEYYSFDPVDRARKLVKRQSDHSVVLGYNHLGERIVEFLREHKQPYVLVEQEKELIDELISLGQPVVVGDYTSDDIIELSGIKKSKEIFCVSSNLRSSLIAAEKARELNKNCKLYMRMFDEHFREFLEGDPWDAYTFSTSGWIMESIKEWTKGIDGSVVILGNDSTVKRIIQYIGEELKKEIYVIDPIIDPDLFELDTIQVYNDKIKYLESLEDLCNLKNVSQVYICWNKEELFSDAILLTKALKQKYSQITVYVRMFDEELARIAKILDAIPFSTSAYAFKMLQKEVDMDSGISLIKEKKS
ncbi:MAG: NAD-binding protein [Candidatus Thorarchaeota archaeon]